MIDSILNISIESFAYLRYVHQPIEAARRAAHIAQQFNCFLLFGKSELLHKIDVGHHSVLFTILVQDEYKIVFYRGCFGRTQLSWRDGEGKDRLSD